MRTVPSSRAHDRIRQAEVPSTPFLKPGNHASAAYVLLDCVAPRTALTSCLKPKTTSPIKMAQQVDVMNEIEK